MSSSNGELFFGVFLALISACLLAFAMSVQRYGLKTPPPVPFLCGKRLPQFWVWFSGLVIYWIANVLFAMALLYAPLALLGAIFTTLLIWNLLFGRLLLGEKITVIKGVGATLIMIGVGLIGWGTPSNIPTDLTRSDVESYLNSLGGATFLVLIIIVILLSVMVIAVFERNYPLAADGDFNEAHVQRYLSEPLLATYTPAEIHLRKRTSVRSSLGVRDTRTRSITLSLMKRNGLKELVSNKSPENISDGGLCDVSREIMIEQVLERNVNTPPWLDSLMGVVYPGSLGLDEGITQLAMKAFMALFSSCAATSDCGAAILWGMVILWLISSLATLWWLQNVFRRYDVTQALPIQYGAVMVCDALSSIFFYRENTYMNNLQLGLVLSGVVVIIIGIVIGRLKTRRLKLPVH